jgi:hypothetical protein
VGIEPRLSHPTEGVVPESHLLTFDRRREDSAERLTRTKTKIAARIARVCSEWTPDDFDILVTHMAEVEIKYEHRRRAEALSYQLQGVTPV